MGGMGMGLGMGNSPIVFLAKEISPGNSNVSCLLVQSGSSGLAHTIQATDNYCNNIPFIVKSCSPGSSADHSRQRVNPRPKERGISHCEAVEYRYAVQLQLSRSLKPVLNISETNSTILFQQ